MCTIFITPLSFLVQNCFNEFNCSDEQVQQDDIDNWRSVTEASKSPIARRYNQKLVMGIGHSGPHEEYPGDVATRYISESNQRNFYNRWEEFMNAESWADIPIDPITADFDGTATMKD